MARTRFRLILALCVAGAAHLVTVPSRPHAQAVSASPEARAARVEQGLLPGIVIAGRPLPAKPLAERMAALKTPGVSVAVINGGVIEWAKGYGVIRNGWQHARHAADPVPGGLAQQACGGAGGPPPGRAGKAGPGPGRQRAAHVLEGARERIHEDREDHAPAAAEPLGRPYGEWIPRVLQPTPRSRRSSRCSTARSRPTPRRSGPTSCPAPSGATPAAATR